MRISGRVRAFTALLALLLLGAMASAGSASALPAKFWGVVPQTVLSEEHVQRLQRGGVKTMRVPFDWGGLQEGGKTAPITFSSLDPIVERAAKANIEVLPFLTGAPNWAVPSVFVPGDRNAKAPAHLPASGAAATYWRNFLTAAVARYGSTGTFWAENPGVPKRPIKVWQIWNEENFKYFVAHPNPAEYGRLVKLSYTAIKSADPAGQLLLGGMFALPKGCAVEKRPKSICAVDFLEQMYRKTPGIRTKFNAAALHPYSGKYQELTPRIEEFRGVLAANKDAAKGLWITELGWSSQPLDPGRNIFAKGVGGQAAQLRGAFTLLRNKQVKWKLQRVYWFSVDDAVGACNFCDGSGLFGDGFVPKKSWYDFVKFAGGTP
jgi:hypothetical protein